MPLKIYLDNNILISIENEKYSIEHFRKILTTKDLVFPYSQAHAFEWLTISGKGNLKKEHFLKKRFKTVRKTCRNNYFYRDYKSNTDQNIIRDPQDAYNDVSSCPMGLKAINSFANLVSAEQVERIRAQFGIDPMSVNNIAPSEVIAHLNTKLGVWKDEYTFVEMIEKSVSYFPNSENFGRYQRFAAYFAMLDLLGYWKDKPTNNSNVARLWDSNHAYFSSSCDYFVSDDKRARQKARVVFDLCQIKTHVISGSGSFED